MASGYGDSLISRLNQQFGQSMLYQPETVYQDGVPGYMDFGAASRPMQPGMAGTLGGPGFVPFDRPQMPTFGNDMHYAPQPLDVGMTPKGEWLPQTRKPNSPLVFYPEGSDKPDMSFGTRPASHQAAGPQGQWHLPNESGFTGPGTAQPVQPPSTGTPYIQSTNAKKRVSGEDAASLPFFDRLKAGDTVMFDPATKRYSVLDYNGSELASYRGDGKLIAQRKAYTERAGQPATAATVSSSESQRLRDQARKALENERKRKESVAGFDAKQREFDSLFRPEDFSSAMDYNSARLNFVSNGTPADRILRGVPNGQPVIGPGRMPQKRPAKKRR